MRANLRDIDMPVRIKHELKAIKIGMRILINDAKLSPSSDYMVDLETAVMITLDIIKDMPIICLISSFSW